MDSNESISADSGAQGQHFLHSRRLHEAWFSVPIVPSLCDDVALPVVSPRTDFNSLSENRIGQPLDRDFIHSYEACMKKNQFQNLSRCFVVTLLAVVVSSTIARSQNKVVLTPLGENTSGYRADVSLNASVTGFGQVDVSSDHVSCNYIATRIIGDVYANPPVWKPKSPGIIIAAKSTPGRPGAKGKYVYLLKVLVRDDATGYVIVHVLDYTLANSQTGPVDHPDPPLKVGLDYGQSWVQVDGDATYVRSSAYVFVYRDSVSSWQIDSTGVGNSITGISLDTAQNVYAASTNGVFKQNPDSNVWHQITNLPTSNFSNILVDRRDNIFAANYVSYNGKGTYVSTG